MVVLANISRILALLILFSSVRLYPADSPVLAANPVQVSIASSENVAPESNFTAKVNISEVAGFDACNYDISFDSFVLRLDNVTSGKIGSTSIPVDVWNKVDSGTHRIVQNVPDVAGISGSGYLAELSFHVIGAAGTSSTIRLSNGVLSNSLAVAILATWVAGSVSVASGSVGSPTPSPTPSPSPTATYTPPPYVPPAGGSGPVPQPKPASIIDSKGSYTDNFTARSEDSKIELAVGKGTISLTKEKTPASTIVVRSIASPAPPPKNFAIVASTYNLGPEGTTFEPPVKITLAYDPSKLPSGAAEKDMVIAWWDAGAKEWTKLADSKVDTNARTVTASVSHLTVFTILAGTPPPPTAIFAVKDLAISPSAAKTGEKVTISVVVTNSGKADGIYELTLKTDSAKEVRTLAVPSGSSKPVSFTVTAEKAGKNSVDINGLAGSFTVEPPAATLKPAPAPAPVPSTAPAATPAPTPVLTQPSDSFSWAWLGGVIGGLVIVALAVFFWIRSRLSG